MYHRDSTTKELTKATEIPEEAMQVMERYDETAIVHRLTTGMAGDAFIYRYPIKTKTGVKELIGISTDGSYELASMLGNIEVLSDVRVDKESDPEYFYAMVRAKDVVRNVTLLGVGRQCKFMVDAGNKPIHDRLNEHAFVACISKAQRNAILHLCPEEIIAKIIDTWINRGKSKQFNPPSLAVEKETPHPAPAPAVKPPTVAVNTQQIVEQQEKLKKLRMEVHNKFQTDLNIGVEKRKQMLGGKFGVESLTDLNEQQLNECKAWVEEMIEQGAPAPAPVPAPAPAPIPAPAPAVVQPSLEAKAEMVQELGFESSDEQTKLRGRLYTMLTSANQLNLKDDEAKKFITDRNFTSATEIPKDKLLGLIQEVDGLIKAKQTPTEF